MDNCKDVLVNKNNLQKEMAAVKKISRKVFMMSCPAEKEWILKPSNTRRNRLRCLAIANKHASIKGMPIIMDEENKQIVKRLLAMRGSRNPKQKKLWDEGNLYLSPAVVSLKGGAKWINTDDNDEKLANWVAKGHHGEMAWSNMHAIILRRLSCPGCSKRVEVTKLKMVKGA